MTLWTIGHSTRTLEDFIALLQANGIRSLVDVRTVPKSRRHPYFAGDALASSLQRVDIAYHHLPALGGLRKPRRNSTNLGWLNESFRGYADHMQTDAFVNALTELEGIAAASPTAVMCAEAVWWRCHRRLIADALVARGHQVRHIISTGQAELHRLTSFARVRDGRVDYPGLLG